MTTGNLILATAGHVDHGKTALVKALTGTDTDRLPEEKARGITIELGFAHLAFPGYSIGVIDVPGHEDFIRNMIAGLGAIDLALLVVAADDGWMAQTEEHLQILDYLEVRHGLVAITKADLGVPGELPNEIRTKLNGTSLAGVPILTTSVRKSEGLEELKQTLREICGNVEPSSRMGKARLFVDRVFTAPGAGTIVTGTLAGGHLSKGGIVFIQPQNLRARIRGLQSHHQPEERALPHTRTALNLPELEPGKTPRGSVITDLEEVLPSREMDVLLRRSARSSGRPLKSGSVVQIHYGSARFNARVTMFDQRGLLPGESQIARLVFDQPVFAFAGDRLIVRDSSAQRTIAGGIVLDPDAETGRFRSPAQRAFLEMRASEPNELPTLLISQLRRDHFVARSRLLSKSNFSREEIDHAIARTDCAVVKGEIVSDAAWWTDLVRRATAAIAAVHLQRPHLMGMELSQLRRFLDLGDSQIFEALLSDLCQSQCVRDGPLIRRREHRPALPPQLQRVGTKIRAALTAHPFDPPPRRELAADSESATALRFLCQNGEAISLGEDVVIGQLAFEQMKNIIAQTLRQRGPATVSELRQVLGTTRRVLVPLLEQLDRIGLTIRMGDRRALHRENSFRVISAGASGSHPAKATQASADKK